MKRADQLKRNDKVVDSGKEFRITHIEEKSRDGRSIYYITIKGLGTVILWAHEKIRIKD